MRAPSETIPAGGRKSALRALLILLWSFAVLVLFLAASASMVAPVGGGAATLALAGASAWTFLFTGWRLMRQSWIRLPAPSDPAARTACELGLGMGAVMLLMLLLGVARLYYPWCGAGLLIALAWGDPRPLLGDLRERLRSLGGGGDRLCVLLICLVGGMTLLESLAPATSQDALVYHLAVPARYIRDGGIGYIPGNFFASFPQNMEMLFTLALLIQGSPLANCYHWLAGAGATLAVAALARRLAGGKGGWLAACIFATIPSVALIAAWAYVDLAMVFFQLLAFIARVEWWEPSASPAAGGSRWIALAGIFSGLAAGCKYTGGSIGILVATAAVGAGLLRMRPRRESFAAAFIAAVLAAAVAIPWYLKNLILTGNPLYPFLFGIFGGRGWDAERAAVLTAFLGEWGGSEEPLGLLALPWRLTFSARFFSIEYFDGFIGPVFLAGAPLAFIAIRKSPPARLVFAIALGLSLLWLITTRQIRFLIPALACASVLVGAGIPLAPSPFPARAAKALLSVGLAFNTVLISTHFASHNPIPVVLGYESKDSYLSREIPGGDYHVFTHIDKRLPGDARILFAGSGNPGFLCRRDYHMDAIFENRTLEEILRAGKTPDGVLDELVNRGYTHLLFRWDLIFDPRERKSGIALDDQLLFAEFLNLHSRLEIERGGTCLYRIGAGSGPADSGSSGAETGAEGTP